MKNITLREACHVLNRHKAVEIAGHIIPIKNVEYTNENDAEFLQLEWSDEGLPFNVSFAVKDNKFVDFDGKTLYLVSTFGDQEILNLQ